MPDYSRVGAGHLATLMHRALKRGDTTKLAALRAECARRPAVDQDACRREWIRQCPAPRRWSDYPLTCLGASSPGAHHRPAGRENPQADL